MNKVFEYMLRDLNYGLSHETDTITDIVKNACKLCRYKVSNEDVLNGKAISYFTFNINGCPETDKVCVAFIEKSRNNNFKLKAYALYALDKKTQKYKNLADLGFSKTELLEEIEPHLNN